MTITWGAWEDSGGNGMRAGIQIESTSSVTNGSTTFVVTFSRWTQNRADYADNQTFDLTSTGGVAATISDTSLAYTNNEVGTATKRGPNITATYTYSTYGTSPGSIKLNGTVNGTYNGVTPNVTVSVTVPARPWANPAPTTLASASRVSDTQGSITWTNNSTTSALYGNIKLYRKTDAGSFALIATLGVVTSYSDTGIVANHKYRWRPNVLGANGAEVTGAETGDIWTTPGTPSACTATKQPNSDIVVTWTNNVNYSEYTVRIEESQNGGAFTEIASVATGITTWTHVAPSTGVTHQYRVRARTTTGTTLNSGYSTSNTVTLLSTANAPTGLSPSGTYFDATEAIVFTWTHNPTDGTPQSKYQLQWSTDGGTNWTTVGPTLSGVSSYTMPASTTTNGQTITWHVATAGENGTLSAYSANAVFNTQDRPTSTISNPGASYSLSKLTGATWTYFQAQSSAQASWHAYLWQKGALSDYSDATLVGEVAGTGTTSSVDFTATLLDGATYGIRVYVTSATGLTSSATGTPRQEFTVTYLPPADATLSLLYDADHGRMTVTITGTSPSVGVTEAIDTVDLQRQIDGGPWVTWVIGVVLDSTTLTANLVDALPTVHGTNNYRAIIRSAVPSSKYSPEVAEVTTEARWGFLSSFAGNFADALRMRARLAGRSATGRSKNVYVFAGREDPVELSGEDVSKVYDVAATLYGTSSTPEEAEDMGETTGIVLWRDYRGRRMFASISPVSVNYNTDSVLFPVTFSLTRVDYDENVG